MSIKSLFGRWLGNRTVRVSIPGNLDPEPFEEKRIDKAMDQSEVEALFQSVLEEEQRDARPGHSVNH
ncbi:hypothetical protein [Ruegeria atlantica]|uniref:hypothetical protein n=1 Tax=Ruegeria atlantica TaxID=81569 RepID=UPI001480C665|nr:hypothetical protein [Ruegeria atlantica]